MNTFDKTNHVSLFLTLLLFCAITGIDIKYAVAADENLLKYSEELTSSEWRTYGTPTITINGDGSQTIAQTTVNQGYARQKMINNECVVDNGAYVFRAQVNPTGEDYAVVTVENSLIREDGSADDYERILMMTTPKDTMDWIPITIPFRGNKATSPNAGYFQITGPNAINTIQVKNLQIASNPGTALYSTGDSICEYSYNDFTVDSAANYTSFYGYDKNIVFINSGVAGELLSEIYSRMQVDLASTSYPVIFIEGGINDINNNLTPLEDMMATMTAMIDLAKSRADRVVVFNIPPNVPWEDVEKQSQYNSWLTTECASQGPAVDCFDMVAVLGNGGGVYGQERNMAYYDADPAIQIHPTAAGHRAIADALISQINLPGTTAYIGDYVKTEGTCVVQNQ